MIIWSRRAKADLKELKSHIAEDLPSSLLSELLQPLKNSTRSQESA